MFVSKSDELYENMQEIRNDKVINYIKYATISRTTMINAAGYEFTCVNNGNWFYNRSDNFGYFCPEESDGICGYIAANLLLSFYDTFRDCDYVDDTDMTAFDDGENREMVGTLLTNRLYALRDNNNLDDGIAAGGAKKIINGYLSGRGKSEVARFTVMPGFNGNTLKNYIQDDNKPVILFGSIHDPDTSVNEHYGHAVVVYGYKKGGNGINRYGFLVHYGWEDYSAVAINCTNNSTFGTICYLDI